MEVEHFALDACGGSLPYEAASRFLERCRQQGETPYFEDGKILGFYNEDYSVTLEPASQIEISISPKAAIGDVEKIYRDFRRRADELLEEEGFRLVNAGYHPYKKADELALIPKERYRFMDHYFEELKGLGKYMMRATASTQVSIDYWSEEDFVEKYRLACILSPVLSLLTENSPVFEGKPEKNHLVRPRIWMNTDAQRCGIFPVTFEDGFGFEAYARYIYQMPAILVFNDAGEAVYTGHKPISGIYGDTLMSRAQIEHVLSMFFPDVRLKNYIEIRVADSMEIGASLQYTALMKSIFYEQDVRRELTEYFGKVSAEDIEAAKREAVFQGFDGMAYGKSFHEICSRLKGLVLRYASAECLKYGAAEFNRLPGGWEEA